MSRRHVWCAHLDCGWSGQGECMNKEVTEHHEIDDKCEHYESLESLVDDLAVDTDDAMKGAWG